MKKFLVIAAAILIQMTPAFAKEVYVGARDGLEFFVETNSIDVIFSNEFYVTVNEYAGATLYDANDWKFYRVNSAWLFDYYYGKRIPVSSSQIAGKILDACRTAETRISR